MNSRFSILAAPGVGMVHGSTGSAKSCRMHLADRITDGIAFPGEQVVRLPRRITRDHHGLWMVEHGMLSNAARTRTRR